MSSLGINVGHTGGSMLGEAMVALRGVGMAAKGITGKGFGSSGGGSASSNDGAGAFSGGLAGRCFPSQNDLARNHRPRIMYRNRCSIY